MWHATARTHRGGRISKFVSVTVYCQLLFVVSFQDFNGTDRLNKTTWSFVVAKSANCDFLGKLCDDATSLVIDSSGYGSAAAAKRCFDFKQVQIKVRWSLNCSICES